MPALPVEDESVLDVTAEPGQIGPIFDNALSVNPVSCRTTAVAVAVQPPDSVTVTVKLPEAKPVAVAVVWPFGHR